MRIRRAGTRESKLALAGLTAVVAVMLAIGSGSAPKAGPQQMMRPGYHGLPDPYVDAEATAQEIKKLALRTHGQYDQLSTDEVNWVEGVSANHGRQMLKQMADRFEKEAREQNARKKDPHRKGEKHHAEVPRFHPH